MEVVAGPSRVPSDQVVNDKRHGAVIRVACGGARFFDALAGAVLLRIRIDADAVVRARVAVRRLEVVQLTNNYTVVLRRVHVEQQPAYRRRGS